MLVFYFIFHDILSGCCTFFIFQKVQILNQCLYLLHGGYILHILIFSTQLGSRHIEFFSTGLVGFEFAHQNSYSPVKV